MTRQPRTPLPITAAAIIVFRFVASLTVALSLLAITACNTADGPSVRTELAKSVAPITFSTEQDEPTPAVASPDTVTQPELSLAELFNEGERSNQVTLLTDGHPQARIVGNAHLQLLAIADAAGSQGDQVTQYAALHLAIVLSPAGHHEGCWERYASLFETLPPCGAAALAKALDGAIKLGEQFNEGLCTDSAIAVNARMLRAEREYAGALEAYNAGQGYIDDDEDLIMQARLHAHAAGVINGGASNSTFDLVVRQLLTKTRGDLWESQAQDADHTFMGGLGEWSEQLEKARDRANATKRLYERGVNPTVPQRLLP